MLYILFLGTCKHLVASLCVMKNFKATGTLNIEQSCTETLQGFRRPSQQYKGRPVPAEHIGKGIKEDEGDPRPVEFRNRPAYQSDVFNATVNFCNVSGQDVSMRYAFGKANIQQAMLDHDYLNFRFARY